MGVLVEAQFDLGSARILYEKLKASPLYDAAGGQWNSALPGAQRPPIWNRYATAQLLGVLVEATFKPEGARALYENLKATRLFDSASAQWNHSMSEPGVLSTRNRFADEQLLGVLAEAQWNPERARVLYEELKRTRLYDPECGQWNSEMSTKELWTSRLASSQLLGVLVEAKLLATFRRSLTDVVPPLPITEAY